MDNTAVKSQADKLARDAKAWMISTFVLLSVILAAGKVSFLSFLPKKQASYLEPWLVRYGGRKRALRASNHLAA